MQLLSIFVILSGCFTFSLSATVTDVKNDIANISSQVATLDTAITSFPATGGSLLQALTIHSDSTSLVTSINKGTTDVTSVPSPFSEADGQAILTSVEAFEPTILHALQQIVAKKPAFVALPLGGIPALVKQDLSNLAASTSSFEASLIASAPNDLVSQATTIKSNIDAAFASAIAAYSSV